MKLHKRGVYLSHCTRLSVNLLPEIQPPRMPCVHIRQLESHICIAASLQDFGEHYRMESVVRSAVDEFSKTMHEFPKLGEHISCKSVISSALCQPCSLLLQRHIIMCHNKKYRQAKQHL